MNCEALKLPDGSVVIVCQGGRRKAKKCLASSCAEPVVALCDWKLHTFEGGKRRFSGARCDGALCADHRRRVGHDKDLCPCHYERAVREGFVAVEDAQKEGSS